MRSDDAPAQRRLPRVRREDHALLGVFNFSEIVRGAFRSTYLGYMGFLPHAGKGYMTEGMALALDVAFRKLGCTASRSTSSRTNARSLALAKRIGFTREGYSRRYVKIAGRWRDHERYAMLAEDWTSCAGKHLGRNADSVRCLTPDGAGLRAALAVALLHGRVRGRRTRSATTSRERQRHLQSRPTNSTRNAPHSRSATGSTTGSRRKAPVAFQIYYKEGIAFVSPVSRDDVRESAGVFNVHAPRRYCLRWEAGRQGALVDFRIRVLRVATKQ